MIIDADGQHPIELFDDFYKKWEEGYKVVVGTRTNDKGEGFTKKVGSWLFYKILGILGGETSSGLTDFSLIDRRVVDEFNKLTERNRITRNLIEWLGFNRALVPFESNNRHAGTATYSTSKLFKLAINGIIKHSTRPLKLIGLLGILISFVSAILLIFVIIEKYIFNDAMGLSITGSAILAMFLSFLIGIVLTCQGLLALYIETVFHETQNRPLYVIAEEE